MKSITGPWKRRSVGWRVWLAVLCLAASAQAQPLFPIRQGDLQGLIDANGRVVLAPEFAELVQGDPLVLARKGSRTA